MKNCAMLLFSVFLISVCFASNTITSNALITVIGLPPGSQIPLQIQNPLGTYNTNIYPITNWTTIISIPYNTAEMNTYHGQIPFQFMGNGTTELAHGTVYTINESAGAGFNGMIMSNTLTYKLPFYAYFNSSIWNTTQATELEAIGVNSSTAMIITHVTSVANTSSYGTVKQSGSYVMAGAVKNYATYNATYGVDFITTNILKNPSPVCAQMSSPTTKSFCLNATIPSLISVATCGGKLCVTGLSYYWLNFSVVQIS